MKINLFFYLNIQINTFLIYLFIKFIFFFSLFNYKNCLIEYFKPINLIAIPVLIFSFLIQIFYKKEEVYIVGFFTNFFNFYRLINIK
jgi:hypothetical protein